MRLVSAQFLIADGGDTYRVLFRADAAGKPDSVLVEKDGVQLSLIANRKGTHRPCTTHATSIVATLRGRRVKNLFEANRRKETTPMLGLVSRDEY